MTNLEHSFEYSCEEAKKSFQANISSLLELHVLLQGKFITAQQNGKSGIFIPMDDAKVILQWLLDAAGNQLAAYTQIDATNRKTNKLFRAALAIHERQPRTPSIKNLIA